MNLTDSSEGLVPIFDSLSHPSLDGSWLSPRHGLKSNTFADNIEAMTGAGVKWAWAVAMDTSDAYAPIPYVNACVQSPVTLLPAAFMRPPEFSSVEQIADWLRTRKQQGYRGVKLHPRLADFDFQHPWLATIIVEANKHGLLPFLCTYCYSASPTQHSLTVENLGRLLRIVPHEDIVLLHAGTTRLLEVAELTRHFKRALVDVSWTLCEYAGSSIDLDLRYVFSKCYSRVCIGSDAPEFSPVLMRARFEALTQNVPLLHRERIAFRNLLAVSKIAEAS
jgi:predicted TIM-barrel fold metal-dependent hydrolase